MKRQSKKILRNLIVLLFAGLIIQPAFAAHIPVTIEEIDGSPSIANIRKIKVAPNKITSFGNGVLALDLNGSAANTAGTNGMIQYNLDNGFAAEAAFTYDASTEVLSINGSDFGFNVAIDGTLDVAGNTTLSGTLNAGASTLASATITNNASVGGALSVTGNATIDTNTLFVDASNDMVGIKTLSPIAELTVNGIAALKNGVTAPTSSNSSYGRLYVNSNNLYYMPSGSTTGFLLNNGNVVASAAGSNTQVQFNNSGSLAGDSAFTWDQSTDALSVGKLLASSNINGTSLNISDNGNIAGDFSAGASTLTSLSVINSASVNGTLSVTGNTTLTGNLTIDTNTFFVDAASNKVGIGTTSPESLLTVEGTTAMRANQSTPSNNTDYGRLYVKSNGNLYYLPAGSSTAEYLVNNNNNNTSVVTPTENYGIGSTDNIVLVNGDLLTTVTLPAASSYVGRVFTVKKIDDGTNMVTVDPNGSERIDGQLQYHLNLQYEAIKVTSDGSNWFII